VAPSEGVLLPVAEVDFAFEVDVDFELLVTLALRFVLEPGLLKPPVGSGGSDFSLSNLPPNTEVLIAFVVLESGS
jgi:hypothetical protein